MSPRCLTSLEIERGGLFTLDDTNLLRIVFANADSVLLTRNLKSYISVSDAYLNEQMEVQVGTFRVFLIFPCNPASFP